MCGLGLVSLYQTDKHRHISSWARFILWLLTTCQLWLLWLLSRSTRVSGLWFHSCWALCCQRTGPALLLLPGSERHCLCVLSSAGVSACCLYVFVLAEWCSETPRPCCICKATIKRSKCCDSSPLCAYVSVIFEWLALQIEAGTVRLSLLCLDMRKNQNK